MEERLSLSEILVVEGKHDAIRLESVVDGVIFATDGFRIFKDKKRLEQLRQLAKQRGVVLLTDSDSAGFVIRNYLIGALPGISVRHAYIPEVPGKEKRKATPGKEGLLGVEGMEPSVLRQALIQAGVTQTTVPSPWLTRARLYEDGLVGRWDSARRREAILKAAGLPPKLSTTKMLEWMNTVWTEADYRQALEDTI